MARRERLDETAAGLLMKGPVDGPRADIMGRSPVVAEKLAVLAAPLSPEPRPVRPPPGRVTVLTTCHACGIHLLDYPFVHQYCQHVVCARCSWSQKEQLYCVACRSAELGHDMLLGHVIKNGHSKQIADIVSVINQRNIDDARTRVARDAPNAHAAATIQTSAVVNAASFHPIYYDQLQAHKKTSSGPFCGDRRCCCLINWGCACGSWCCDRLAQLLAAALAFVMMVAVLWALWFLWSGETTLRNAPFFNKLDYIDKATPPPPFSPITPSSLQFQQPPLPSPPPLHTREDTNDRRDL